MDILASVIIVNWNGERFLKDLFTALSAQNYPPKAFEVIMVDNCSSDNSIPYVHETFPNVRIIKNDWNGGFSNGNNVGIKGSLGKYIVLLNNDTIPEPDWLSELIRVADEQNAGATVSKLLFAKKRNVINNAGSVLRLDRTWPVTERGSNEIDSGQYEDVVEVSAFCGASVLLRRTMLQEIGLLDEYFFMYFEDADLSWRAQKKGWKFYYSPKSVVYHIHTGTSTEHSPLFTYYVSRNRMLVLIKNATGIIAIRGIAAVLRDRLVYGLRQFLTSLKNHSGRAAALNNLELGSRVFLSLFYYGIIMLFKRYHLFRETILPS